MSQHPGFRTLVEEPTLSTLFEQFAARVAAPAPVPAQVRREEAPAPQPAPVRVEVQEELVASTDGSSLGNPGPGGWCWFVDHEHWASGGHLAVTNNAMELRAVAELLEASARAHPGRALLIRSDSRYVIDACTKWIHGWRRNGWMTGAKKPVANRELIERIDQLMRGRDVRFEWVRGHNGDVLNEAADARCTAAASQAKKGSPGTYGPGMG